MTAPAMVNPMVEWYVWAEGYQATGESGRAVLLGSALAPSFRAACDVVLGSADRMKYYDRERLTYWGCRLFDNSVDARQSFG